MKSDDVDGDLEVAIEEEKNRVDVAEVCVSVERCVDVCWQGQKNQVIERGRQKDTEKVKRSDI